MSEAAARTVHAWITNIQTTDFSEIAVRSTEEREEGCEREIICNVNNIVEEEEGEDGKIVYSDGMRYVGPVCNHQPHGVGQLTLSDGVLLTGHFTRGLLEGEVRSVSPQDCSVTRTVYHRGVQHGTYTHTRMDGQLLAYGMFRKVHLPFLSYSMDGSIVHYSLYGLVGSVHINGLVH